MRDVAIIGVGMTRFGRFPDATLKSLGHEAVAEALEHAGLGVGDVQSAFAANAIAGLITGQEMIRGQTVLRGMGFSGIPIVNVENACAGGATAVHLAWQAVATEQVDVAIAIGVEKMTHEDRRRPIEAIATALDLDDGVDLGSASPFMEVYAKRIQTYMRNTGATAQDFATVAAKAQRNGACNPLAQYGDAQCTAANVLASSLVADPLTVKMVSPVGDGAAAVVVASPGVVGRMGVARPVWIRSSVLRAGADSNGQGRPGAIELAARAAYEVSGIGPQDLDVVELHDANAASEMMRYEYLGLASPGDGVALVRDGTTELTGTLPVNPSGGLIAKGHPIGATGCAQITELYRQLTGTAGERQVAGARVAMAENGGGWIAGDVAADVVHILST